jgi:hypothetical protein
MHVVINEKLDRLYVCKECNACYLFRSDIAEHEEKTEHDKVFAEVLIDAPAR